MHVWELPLQTLLHSWMNGVPATGRRPTIVTTTTIAIAVIVNINTLLAIAASSPLTAFPRRLPWESVSQHMLGTPVWDAGQERAPGLEASAGWPLRSLRSSDSGRSHSLPLVGSVSVRRWTDAPSLVHPRAAPTHPRRLKGQGPWGPEQLPSQHGLQPLFANPEAPVSIGHGGQKPLTST